MSPRIPSKPSDFFACSQKDCDVQGSRCLELQASAPEDPDALKDHDPRLLNRFCWSGECIQGARVRAALEQSARPLRICTGCKRVQLSESTAGDLCSKCRPVDAAPASTLMQRAAPYLAQLPAAPRPPAPVPASRAELIRTAAARTEVHRSAPPPTPPATPAQKEIPMAIKKCSAPEGCDGEASSRGLCGKHYQRILKAERAGIAPKPVQLAPAPRTSKPAAAKQLPLAGMPASADLPEISGLPDAYLVKCAEELKRRALAMYRAAKSILNFDPAEHADVDA